MRSDPETAKANADYIMGHSDHEIARLQLQSELLAPVTRRLLDAAGLRPGMRVVDIGCGTGDVTAMMAEIVGDEGNVLGIDRSEIEVRFASARQTTRPNMRFEAATLQTLGERQPFDFAFGRYILMHQPDPVALVRSAAAAVKPGGILAFHEIVLGDGFPAAPRSPLWDDVNGWFVEAFRKLLPQGDVASRLVACFASAGLQAPHVFSECVVGEAATSPITRWFAETIRTLAPELETSFGVARHELAIETLAERLRREAADNSTQVFSSRQVCAWSHT